MLRRLPLFLLLALAASFLGTLPAHAQDKEAKALTKKLQTKVSLDKGIDPNTPLKEALEFLAERFDLTIVLDEKAFAAVAVQKVGEQPVSLKPVKDTELGKVLDKLLVGVDGTYKIEKNRLRIVPKPQK